MSVLEIATPVQAPVKIEVEPNQDQRDILGDQEHGRAGNVVSQHHPFGQWSALHARADRVPLLLMHVPEKYPHLVDLFDRTIPGEELVRLERLHNAGVQGENGGYIRGFSDAPARVATYNNTRASEQEILDWIDRTLLLAESESFSQTQPQG